MKLSHNITKSYKKPPKIYKNKDHNATQNSLLAHTRFVLHRHKKSSSSDKKFRSRDLAHITA